MKDYNCPDCERTDSCFACPRVYPKAPTQTFTEYGKWAYSELGVKPGNNYCKYCAKHPANGGDGVCHCILGIESIY
jgi:hypothetical protein